MNLNAAETDTLTQALRALSREAVDAANSFDRSYGPEDFRSKDAWSKCLERQREISALGKKLGLSV